MSNITLERISAPGLGPGSYGDNVETQFTNIDINFKRIVQGEYLKGQSGDIVMLEEIDLLTNQSGDALQIKNSFLGYISKLGLGLSPNGIGGINSQKLYMIYTKNEETEGKVYKSSLPYTFLDPRFNPLSDSAKDEGLEDKSCIIVYDESEKKFKSYNSFPNIYFASNQNEFCWKINGQKTLLPARGPKGDTGYTGAVYILSAQLPFNYNPQKPQYVKVKFLIIPAEYSEWDGINISNEAAENLNGQAAFVYANYGENQHIYISQIETSEENGDKYAVCLLDKSCEIHHVFANQTLKDVLTEVKPESSFNYLFIPSKFNATTGKLEGAHVVTTKRSDDNISAPRPGFWWKGYNQDNWNDLADPNICIISPATIESTTRTLPALQNLSGVLYNNYKNTICPGGAFFGRIATGSICFDDATNSLNNKWIISQDPLGYTLLMGGPIAGGNENLVDIANSSLRVSKNLSIDGNAVVTGELSVGGNATIENGLILKSHMSSAVEYDGRPTFVLDAENGGMRLSDLNVQYYATIGELETLNYKVPSLVLSNDFNSSILNPQTISKHLVYLTWDVRDTDRDIPTIANISNTMGGQSKNFLQAGKPKYIINTTEIRGGASISGRTSTDIHLTFDMSKDWPPTQIEWNFGRTPKTISFTNGKVKIYTDFKINTGGDTDNSIDVQNGTSGIDFTNYTGDLSKITSILLTPYDAASVPDYKAYKLTFENASAFSYIDEISGVENKLYVQLSELRAQIENDFLPKSQFKWSNMSDAPTIPVLTMDNDNITIQSGNNSFVFPTNINNRIQTQIDATLTGKNFVSKDTLTMMGGFNSSNSGTNSNDTEPAIQLMNKQAEGYTITDFCSIIVKYLEGNQEVSLDKYLQWPIKGNVIRGVYHPSEPAGTLSMMVTVGKKSTVEIDGITATVDRITIDGRDPLYGLGCSYGVTKTVPWEAKLVGTTNFKTTVSGYVTLIYTD